MAEAATTPAGMQKLILEKLVGATGATDKVMGASRSLAIRAVPLIAKNLNEGLTDPVDFTLKTVEVARIADIRPAPGGYHAMTIAPSAVSADALLLLIDAGAIAVLVSALFGADPDLPTVPIERDLSPTELALVNMVFHQIAMAVNGTGARSLEIRFPIPPVITGEELQKQLLRDGPAARLVFEVSTPTGRGTIELFMPHRVLLSHRADGNGADRATAAKWGAHFGEEIMRSVVRLDAAIPMASMTLGELAALRPGQVLEMPQTAQAETRLSAKDKTLFVCEFGKLGANYTVRVRHPYDAGQQFIDGLFPG
ncbi:MAG: FliM/FliN family flagellar motor switch protein [Rhizobiaceae bacterium]